MYQEKSDTSEIFPLESEAKKIFLQAISNCLRGLLWPHFVPNQWMFRIQGAELSNLINKQLEICKEGSGGKYKEYQLVFLEKGMFLEGITSKWPFNKNCSYCTHTLGSSNRRKESKSNTSPHADLYPKGFSPLFSALFPLTLLCFRRYRHISELIH